MEIIIPRNLDLESSLRFCNNIIINSETERIVYDYKNMTGRLEPLGMLLVGSKIREIIRKYEYIQQADRNFENKMYAANMGFFKSVNQDFGKSCYDRRGTNNFIRINCENIKESYTKAFELGYGSDINRYIEKGIAEDISQVLSRGNSEIKKIIKFCIVEVVRNIYDHSKSRDLWYSGQFWPSENLVEIAILDEGDGIYNTLKNNKRIIVNNPEEALKFSLVPGVSKNSATMKNIDVNGNSGFGLYMIKSICDVAGSFTLISSGKCLNIENGRQEIFEADFSGTAIRVRIKTSKLDDIKVCNLIRSLSQEGTSKVEKLSKFDRISIDEISELEVV